MEELLIIDKKEKYSLNELIELLTAPRDAGLEKLTLKPVLPHEAVRLVLDHVMGYVLTDRQVKKLNRLIKKYKWLPDGCLKVKLERKPCQK